MRVLGIDPGLTRCGFGLVDVRRDRRASLVAVGVIRTAPEAPLERRLAEVSRGIRELIGEHAPGAMAVERVFAQHNLSTVMGTAQASGIALLAAAEHGVPVALHTPSEVKAAVTGSGTAGKRQVATMVARILGLAELPQPADASDALALAICHAWRGGASPASAGDGLGDGADAAASLTPAQRAWRDAERGSRARRVAT
ncbi:crossover junction endodeoxyribonuclease RuvC [Homoserinibacter sp. YIM 151385]|uniref:crossover junction endodeoxyribonuclease RuvC n=1 Tax=Homoserinibacter sp. YIM 151385 TaxID=2985506 RepID=UPI0022F03787|nr:crossover junction endodeoxyribonuclease RuvC [Homoserinibacter sp. YIM 151385]WBU38682.1 crossover junction endodeoxyribonuclease RuvC [Homoserinibacter sp. YIM 151385]